ncbi:hypothetical protein V2A60_001722 [Cordyceps javanica]|uniref:Uncharacterized protein n=1 Tax=Cordyceps javanica TaxID=43265 RepID=A0A545VG31_9HYPO|nr:hypothetical protein IF1G_00592 [Cordyceps javanica]TQW11842.1 hypothetical protein IF2G_00573 [Cordyceps javanica]
MASADPAALEKRQLEAAKQPFKLLHLPTEIQERIFWFAVHDPDLMDRRHRDGCDLLPVNEHAVAQPPFMSQRVFVDAVYQRDKQGQTGTYNYLNMFDPPESFRLTETWTYCNCAKRSGINLLLTNRWIFSIAAPFFWSENTFSFFDATEFVACMAVTSTGTRALIRSVSVVTFRLRGFLDARVHLSSKTPRGKSCLGGIFPWGTKCLPIFWRTLQLLPKLKSLAIPPCYLDCNVFLDTDANLDKLRPYLERLEEIHLTYLSIFGGDASSIQDCFCERQNFWASFFSGRSLESLGGFSHRVHLSDWLEDEDGQSVPNSMFEQRLWRIRQFFDWDLFDRIYEALHAGLMTVDLQTFGSRNYWRRPNYEAVSDTGTATIQLVFSDGEQEELLHQDFTFYNMPAGKDACAKNRLLLESRRAEEYLLGDEFEDRIVSQGRRRKILTRRMPRAMFCHVNCISREEARYAARGLEAAALASELFPPPQVTQEPPRTKRKRVKKNRRGNRSRGDDDWQE